MLFGAHMSIAGGVDKAIDRAAQVGCDAVQIFTKNNNQWAAKPIPPAQVERFRQRQAEAGIRAVVAHDSYLINLASPDEALWEKSVVAFRVELERCELLGVPYLVTHPGSHTGAGEEVGIRRVAQALNRIHAELPGYRVITLLEITAGQGSALGYRFEQLRAIVDLVAAPERVGYCFDTCHAFAAGYELRTPEGYAETMDAFDRILGLRNLRALHLNDSKRELGSRVDRHDHIGAGMIGLAGFYNVVNDPRLAGLPGLLETPKSEDLHEDAENLARLRSLIGAPRPAEGDAMA
ncbi:MAG: deoxyribonuclease IV [Sphaerobacter sp.]|nr:deoxyribonuclease IV [Sphaerobacter sp.]